MNRLELQGIAIRPLPTGQPLFAPLSLTIAPGAVATLLGPSGIGKSTLLAFIGGHLGQGWQTEGKVRLMGRDVTQLRADHRRIGMLFQDAVLFPHLSVGDNLAFGLTPSLRGRATRRAAVEAALDQAGLSGFHDRDPATLSGGQKARAALMRALLADPLALLLDEPFSKLDPALRAEMRGFVFDHARARAIPVLMVTHDPEDAKAAAGPLIRLTPPKR
ncbi:MAG: ATP-binding cassette domain-containing protein [Rhodobacteraceae bacterium]|nr:ATP-binding cassette domain-containing protein [Paracoccaceae bacterium]